MTADPGNGTAAAGGAELWSLRDDVRVETAPGDGPIRLRSRWGDLIVQAPSDDVREALHRMCLGPISLGNVIDGRPGDRASALTQLRQVLDRLQPLIIRTLGLETGQPLLSAVPITPRSRFRPVSLAPGVHVRLSSFAQLRTNGSVYVVESPLALHRVLLHRPEAVSMIASLSRFATVPEVAAAVRRPEAVVADALAYLEAAGMAITAHPADGDDPVSTEETDPALAGWTPGDLMFHTRSTLGRHDHDFGATYPTGRQQCPEPVVKQRRPGIAIPLHRPRWEDLCSADPPLSVALEGRRSVREQGPSPVSARELGHLLYRTARVRSLILPSGGEEDAAGSTEAIASNRPYPGGGARYELELYVTAGHCAGLAAGTYHYDPLGHQLEPIDADAAAADELLHNARLATGMNTVPSVLITMTARFRRISWKYEGLPYALVLMDAGALIQTFYLVCTAMRLAPCAIGSVRTDLTARAFGTDWRIEPSLGQFVVGRADDLAPGDTGRWRPVNDAAWHDRAAAMLRETGAGIRQSPK
jgi:SagB-type dehydrogenase family enzyme